MSAPPRPPAFVNDLETCVGCHACAVACANENELPPGTSWRHVVTHNQARRAGVPVFHLSIACNHCLDAPCLRHCPALAIARDPRTGAVLVGEDLCIGCRYCSWVCPYDAPRFDASAGVMRKCTLCTHRLVEGLAPACVSLCPVGALALEASSTGPAPEPRPPGFPDAGIRPLIRFLPLRARAQADTPADEGEQGLASRIDDEATPKISLRSEWTLVVFTSVAMALAGAMLGWMIGGPRVSPALFALAGLAAMAVSTSHLGRPLRAWRAGLNWRRSWLSREVIGYSALVGLGTIALAIDVPGGRLAWAATLAAACALVSIDQVYVAMARRGRSRLDDHTTTAAALYVAGLLAQQAQLWLPVAGLRLAILVSRSSSAASAGARLRRLRRTIVGAARVAIGLGVPVLLWLVATPDAWPWAVAAALVGEALDRVHFYDHLEIVTPRTQMADDEAEATPGRRLAG